MSQDSSDPVLNFVLADSALELVPREIWSHPAVVSDCKRRDARPGDILLDRSFHHSAMTKLRESEKRGRPDLVHAALLSVTGTPLYLGGGVKVHLHMHPGAVIEVAAKTRTPKSYLRFRSLMEKCLVERPSEGLLKVSEMTLPELIRAGRPGRVFGLSVRGRQASAEELARKVAGVDNPWVMVGGFPHGHFSDDVEKAIDELVRINPRPLEAHVVTARVVYEVEKATPGFND